MSVTITGKYIGNKNVQLKHGPSGAEIKTAAPLDNNGDGSSFSPTDLVAGSLGACMLTIVGIVAERDSIDIRGAHFSVEKHMSTSPRRIAALPISIHLPKTLEEITRKKLEVAAMACPVHKSLLPEIEIAVNFVYDV